jgi:hypothetical protein
MKNVKRRSIYRYLICSAVALAIVLLISGVSDATSSNLWGADLLAAPGLLIAALAFPQGAHSDFPYLYLGLALVIDGLLLGGLILLFWTLLNRLRRSSRSVR